MTINKGRYQAAQDPGADVVRIFRDGVLLRTVKVTKNQTAADLEKMIRLFGGDDE